MFSILKFFSSSDKFFDLLEESAEHVNSTVVALSDTIRGERASVALDRFVDLEVKDKNVSEEISNLLVETFVTGLEREDIEALAAAMLKIVKTIHKFAERYKSGFTYAQTTNFQEQLNCIIQASEVLILMVKSLRKMPALESIKELKDKLDQQELKADELLCELVDKLYRHETNAIRFIILRDLYDLLEKTTDRLRDAGEVVYHTILKNS